MPALRLFRPIIADRVVDRGTRLQKGAAHAVRS